MPYFHLLSGNTDQKQEIHNILFQQKRCCSRDHYEVLGVDRRASSKDIRKSFIELSKKLHPDINKDPKTHDKFVKLNEAYSTLIKPSVRKDYDLTLALRVRANQREASTVTSHTSGSSHRPGTDYGGDSEGQFYYDETLWHFRDQTKDKFYEQEAQKKAGTATWRFLSGLTNVKIVLGCCGIMFFGGLLHYYTFSASRGRHLENLNDRDRRLAAYHTEAKEQAKSDHNLTSDDSEQTYSRRVRKSAVASCKLVDSNIIYKRRLGNVAQLERLKAIAAANKYTCQNFDEDD